MLNTEPTTKPFIIQTSDVNPRYHMEFMDAIMKREPITLRHLTTAGRLKFESVERNQFYLASYRGRPFWYYTGEAWCTIDDPKYV